MKLSRSNCGAAFLAANPKRVMASCAPPETVSSTTPSAANGARCRSSTVAAITVSSRGVTSAVNARPSRLRMQSARPSYHAPPAADSIMAKARNWVAANISRLTGKRPSLRALSRRRWVGCSVACPLSAMAGYSIRASAANVYSAALR